MINRPSDLGVPSGSVALGILVNTRRHPDYILNLARAACHLGVSVRILFTGKGMALTDPPFLFALNSLAEISFSVEDTFSPKPRGPGLSPACPSTAKMKFLLDCDRFVVF